MRAWHQVCQPPRDLDDRLADDRPDIPGPRPYGPDGQQHGGCRQDRPRLQPLVLVLGHPHPHGAVAATNAASASASASSCARRSASMCCSCRAHQRSWRRFQSGVNSIRRTHACAGRLQWYRGSDARDSGTRALRSARRAARSSDSRARRAALVSRGRIHQRGRLHRGQYATNGPSHSCPQPAKMHAWCPTSASASGATGACAAALRRPCPSQPRRRHPGQRSGCSNRLDQWCPHSAHVSSNIAFIAVTIRRVEPSRQALFADCLRTTDCTAVHGGYLGAGISFLGWAFGLEMACLSRRRDQQDSLSLLGSGCVVARPYRMRPQHGAERRSGRPSSESETALDIHQLPGRLRSDA